MTDELANIEMHLEVMGCPTTCQHCSVVGRSYSAMPLAEIAWVLAEVRRFCEAHALTVGGYPMHEVAAHPQAAAIMRLIHNLWGLVEEPVPTTGVPLAARPDWREFLDTLRELGTSTLWFAFHGAEDVHDRAVRRQGAYHESLRAVELTREIGMRAGCNLFVTAESLPQVEQIVADLQRAGIEEIIPCLYDFLPNARGRQSERLRPTWPEVEPLVQQFDMIPETANWRRFWHELPNRHTEAWYVQQALAGTWPEEPDLSAIWLVCRPNLEVYRGWAGYYRKRYGNLRRDGVEAVLGRAVADGPCSSDEIWLTQKQVVPVQALAARFGHAGGLRIHSGPTSICYWWVECARRAGLAAS